MNKLINSAKIRQLAKDTKGATIVEYVMILIVILVVAVVGFKALGTKVNTSANTASTSF